MKMFDILAKKSRELELAYAIKQPKSQTADDLLKRMVRPDSTPSPVEQGGS
jgi:hypothetical protein